MKLNRIEVVGFRGISDAFPVKLNASSILIYAENAKGKSTIADAIEFWSTGQLPHFKREKVGLSAAINLNTLPSGSKIRCVTDAGLDLARTIDPKGTASDLLDSSGQAPRSQQGPIPLLRHRMMADFVNATRGEKKKALLLMLGLSDLEEFREVSQSMTAVASKELDNANNNVSREDSAYRLVLEGNEAVSHINNLLKTAKLGLEIKQENEIRDLKLGSTVASGGLDKRPGQIEEITRLLTDVGKKYAEDWNAAVKSPEIKEADFLLRLLSAAAVLVDEKTKTCPLCGGKLEPGHLNKEINEKTVELKALLEEYEIAKKGFSPRIVDLLTAENLLGELIKNPPKGGWGKEEELVQLQTETKDQREIMRKALNDKSEYHHQVIDASETMKNASKDVKTGELAPTQGALTSLVQIKESAVRLKTANERASRALAAHKVAEAINDAARAQIKKAIEDEIKKFGDLVGQYYERLMSGSVISDVKINYHEAKSGGVEFSVVFNASKEIEPPQRIVSESQLNALGLALFLAQQKIHPSEWNVLVLDDVVNSFDADHRRGLARLLNEEFNEYQIILLTHDRTFFEYCRRLFPSAWKMEEIVEWSPDGGPITLDADPIQQIKKRLEAGVSASQLGGQGRVALERTMSRVLDKLSLPIRYNSMGRYSAKELLVALTSGISRSKTTIDIKKLASRIDSTTYMSNLGVHEIGEMQPVSSGDLEELVKDLSELEEAFTCQNCGNFVWAFQGKTNWRKHQCTCGQLKIET